MKRIEFSNHANKRLRERRQDGVMHEDVYAACHLAKEILFKGVPDNLRLSGFTSKAGVTFDIVVVDKDNYLLIVTVIGRKKKVRKYGRFREYGIDDKLPYKKKMQLYRKLKKKERNFIEKGYTCHPRYRKDAGQKEGIGQTHNRIEESVR